MTDKTPSSPELLDAEAADLETKAFAADLEPSRLRLAASRRRVLANLLRRRDAAAAELAEAEAEVTRLAGEYEATGPAEAEATTRATEARHLFEDARDAAAEARRGGAAPAVQVEAVMRATAAAEVDEHEQGALAAARSVRQAAYGRLNSARDQARAVKAAIAAAEAAVDNPGLADAGEETDALNLVWSWQVRLLLDKSGDPEHALTPRQRDLCASYAAFFAEAAGVGATKVRQRAQAETRAAINAELARMALVAPDGREIDVSRVLGRL